MGKGMATVGNILTCKVCGISLSYVGILLMVTDMQIHQETIEMGGTKRRAEESLQSRVHS